jgi:hypothetical protein
MEAALLETAIKFCGQKKPITPMELCVGTDRSFGKCELRRLNYGRWELPLGDKKVCIPCRRQTIGPIDVSGGGK